MNKLIDLNNLDYYDKNHIRPMQESLLILAQTMLQHEEQLEELIMPRNPRNIEIVSWTDGSWDKITNMLNAHDMGLINIYDYWKIGDERTIVLNSPPSLVSVYNQLQDQVNLIGVNNLTRLDRHLYDFLNGIDETGRQVLDEQEYSFGTEPILVTIVLVETDAMFLRNGNKCKFIWQTKECLPATVGYTSLNSSPDMFGSNSAVTTYSFLPLWLDTIFAEYMLPSEFKSIIQQSIYTGYLDTSDNNRLIRKDGELNSVNTIFLPTPYNVCGSDYVKKEITFYNKNDTYGYYWRYYQVQSNRLKISTNNIPTSWWLNQFFYDADNNPVPRVIGEYGEELHSDYDVGDYYSRKGIAPCGCI